MRWNQHRGNASTHGLWEQTAPPAPPTQQLCGSTAADVVIIGAGYTGLSAALHLAELGASVAVIEALHIGYGGSGRNVGLVNAGLWVKPDDICKALGPVYGDRLIALLGGAPDRVFQLIQKYGIHCEPLRTGTLHCAVGRSGLKDLASRGAQWEARGVRLKLLDQSETRVKIGTQAYMGSLLDPRAGTIQPLAYARGLGSAAQSIGVRIYSGASVKTAERIDGAWTIATHGGSVVTPWVVVATDAYATGPWQSIRNEQVHLPYFNVATQPLSSVLRKSILPEGQGAWDTRSVLTSFRFDQQDRLIFGSVGALRGTGHSVHRAWALRAMRKLFPQLGNISIGTEWYGMIGMTSDNMPRFHKLAPNVISFSGYNGRGIAPGTVFGYVLANYINGSLADHQLPLPATDPREPPLRRLSEAFYEIGAQIVHGASARHLSI